MDKEGEMATTREGKEKVGEIVPHRLYICCQTVQVIKATTIKDGVPIQFGQEADVGAAPSIPLLQEVMRKWGLTSD